MKASPYSSGSPEIDAIRQEVKRTPTTANNHLHRSLLLYLWVGTLQQLGADTRPLFEVDMRFHHINYRLEVGSDEEIASLMPELMTLIDKAFTIVEDIQTKLIEQGPIAKAFESDGSNFPDGGDLEAEWPMFQGDIHNTGHSNAPGPRYGRVDWKFPVGLGTYVRPVVEDNRVYITSPGMNTTCFCLDLETGNEFWRSSQLHPLFGIYKYPALASTPLVLEDRIVIRDMNSHWGDESQSKYLHYIDKTNGKLIDKKYAGHVDYRTRYASVATNGIYMVYPYGEANIFGTPPICQNFNRLICANVDNNAWLWDFNVGDIDALAEPLVTQDLVIIGTMEGYLYALTLEPNNKEQIAWKFRASGAVNTQVELANGRLYFGCNGGSIYCLNESTGELIWKTQVDLVEKRARKHFSTPLFDRGHIYIGAANKRLYSIDAETGRLIWETEITDWIRAKPAIFGDDIFVASLDGNIHCLNSTGELSWTKSMSTHPIYADLVIANAKLLINDSDLMLYCLSSDGEIIWQKSTLNAYTDDTGRRIFTDVLSGGTYYQSKPTAYQGNIYFGTPSGFIYAVNEETGTEIWKFELGAAISVGPACADGHVFVGQQGGERFFYCLDAATGELIWKQTLPGGWVWGSATVDDGMVYVPTVSGYAVCLDAKTGYIVWMYPTARSVPAEPAIDGDLVYFGSWSQSVYAFDKKTGEVVWKSIGTMLDSGTLIAFDSKVYLPNHSNIFNYLNGLTGELLNEGNTSDEAKGDFWNFNATPAFDGSRAYFTSRGSRGLFGVPLFSTVYCVDPETAEIYWIHPDGGGVSAPAVANGRVYIRSGNSPFFYCLDAETGMTLWVYQLGHRVEESTLCIYRDKVYVLASDGYLHAIK